MIIRISILLLATCLSLMALEYEISETELQQYIVKHFPITKPVLMSTVTLSEPQISIVRESDRLLFMCNMYSAQLVGANNEPVTFRIHATSDIKYREGAVYLDKVDILQVEGLTMKENIKSMVLLLATSALRQHFRKKPVFALEKLGAKGSVAKVLIGDIVIKDGVIHVILG